MALEFNNGSLSTTFDIDLDKGFEDSVRRAFESLSKEGKQFGQNIKQATDRAESDIDRLVRKASQGLAVYASADFAQRIVGQIVKVRGEFEQLEVAFRTMLGSKIEADKLLAEVTEFAATTPFAFLYR